MEFDEFIGAMLSLRQLVNHFEKLRDRDHVLVSPRDMHSILLSFGTVLSVEELTMVMSRLKPEMYRTWRFSEFSDFVANLNGNVTKIRAVSSKRKIEGRKDKGTAYHKWTKNVLLVDRSQTPKIVEKLNIEALKSVLLKCRDTGSKFEDTDFPASNRSLNGLNLSDSSPLAPSQSVVSWRRPSEISDKASLFVEGPTEGDMDAAHLKDTWFLSALSMLTLSPNRNLSGIFLAKYPQYGLYQCRFSKDGEWHVITVDDRLPCDASGRPAFARSRHPDEFWISILEKAYAKLHGSYANIQSGHTREALADLTGEVAEDSPLIYSSELWSMLQLNHKENWLMGCTHIDMSAQHEATDQQNSGVTNAHGFVTPSASAPGGRMPSTLLGETTPCGMLKNFTYSIMRCVQVGPHKLLQLHNPWGALHWRGAWSESAAPWYTQAMADLEVTFDDDSTFFMEFSDWCREFTHLHVLRLPSEDTQRPWEKIFVAGEWRFDSAGGCTNFPSWTLNHQFRFTSTHHEPTTVFISLSHKDRRILAKNSEGVSEKPAENFLHGSASYPSHGLIVMKTSESDENNTKKDRATAQDLEAINTFQNARDNSLEFTALPNTNYIIIPATYQPGVLGSYFFRIQTRHKAQVVPLMTMKANKSVEGAWRSAQRTNGGSILYPSWRNNPQFLLRVFQESKLRVMLLQQDTTPLPPIAFTIFNADPGERRKLELADLVLLPEKYIVSTSVSGDLTLPVGVYNIIASAETPEFENSFKLQVQGSPDSIAIEPLREYTRVHLRDSWTVESAGGCRNHTSWVLNPHFLFTVPPPGGPITIVVAFTEIFKDSAIGCYLFNADAKNTRTTIVGKSKFTHVSVSTTFTLAPGNYILLPCTFNPGIAKDFTIEFFSDLTISNIARMKFSQPSTSGSTKLPASTQAVTSSSSQ